MLSILQYHIRTQRDDGCGPHINNQRKPDFEEMNHSRLLSVPDM